MPWYFAVLAVLPLVVCRPASRSVWTRRTFLQLAGFSGDDTSCAVFSSFVLRPRCSASGRYQPERHICCDALLLVLLVAMHITLCLPLVVVRCKMLGVMVGMDPSLTSTMAGACRSVRTGHADIISWLLVSGRSTGLWIYLVDDFLKCSRVQHLLVRQWIQGCVSLRCSFAFQRNAWFDSGYILPRSSSCWHLLVSMLSRSVHFVVGRPVESPQVQSLRQFQLLALPTGMRGRLFWALYTGTGPGAVSTGTRLPKFAASVQWYRQRHFCYTWSAPQPPQPPQSVSLRLIFAG